MICFPNAKINLGLNITGKRQDGYHNIETVFYPIPVEDALEIVPAKGNRGIFKQSGLAIDGNPENNLVIKAYQTLSRKHSLPEIDIYLLKKIPFGAGLGGGSSDAAFMLKLINEYANLSISEDELEKLSVAIGADCAFFIRNKPVFASGIGNIFEPITLSLEKYFLVLVKPDVHISTKEAYEGIKPGKPEISLKEIIQQPIETWKNRMINDFENIVFSKFPIIKNIKETLYESGAVYASMSGSGSSVFGIFKEEPDLIDTFNQHYIWQGKLTS